MPIQRYLLDLLPLPRPATYSQVVIFVCRLLGCAAIVGVATVGIQHAGAIAASEIFPFGLLVLTVAVLAGNLIKEVAILIAGILINWRGLDFRRSRLTLSGARMREVYRPDGTWERHTIETGKVIHEWSDLNGECHQQIRPIASLY
jgi:hypothetical protein